MFFLLKDFYKKIRFDPYITILSFTLLLFGFAIFFSASMGIMARNEQKFYNILQNQALFGILLGTAAFLVGAIFPKNYIKILTPVLYLLAVFLCLLVYVPGIGFEHGGSRRWISFLGFSLQPSEILKYTSVMCLGFIYSWHSKSKFFSKIFWNNRLVPILLLGAMSVIVFANPDIGTGTVILAGIFGVFLLLKAKLSDIAFLIILTVPTIFFFYSFFPHAQERINTFIFPEKNTGHQNYQVEQTKISLGSGGLWGVGFAQGIQKYHHLPEPVGDSIFAVVGEEMGFIGTTLLLFLILTLGFRLIYLSLSVHDYFGKSILIGVGIIILAQSFLNAGSVSGAIPFTGIPFPLVSHGSTSIILTMAMLGLCSQISTKKYSS